MKYVSWIENIANRNYRWFSNCKYFNLVAHFNDHKSTQLKSFMQEILSKKEIGERIKNLRLKNKLSQSIVAEKLNISRSNYSQIEIGNQFPSFYSLYLISNLYGKSYEWLIHGIEPVNQVDLQKPLQINDVIKDMQLTLTTFQSVLTNLEGKLNIMESNSVEEKLQKL